MKYLFILFISCSLYVCTENNAKSSTTDNVESTQQNNTVKTAANLTTIEWIDSTHQDFGVINEGQVLEINWKFKNTGDKPLVITNASASCGCTVAERPEEPIAPGATGVIKAKFDSKDRVGPQNKQVYVEANTKDNASSPLTFAVGVKKK